MNECDLANRSRIMKHNKNFKGRIMRWKFCQLIIVLLKIGSELYEFTYRVK